MWLSGSAEEVAVDVPEGLPAAAAGGGGEVAHGDFVDVRAPDLPLNK